MLPNIEIIVGTYEEFLLGYKIELKDEKSVLTQSFADKSHAGALKCVAASGHWIATGATDDRIFIYDMRTRKQSEILLVHEGTINALAFTPDETHLLSGGDDGRMVATRVSNWRTSAAWKKAHDGSAVTHISCHPSGKLALSLGTDLILRTWNLVKGRVAYKTNLKSRTSLGRFADCLTWSPTGDYFALSGQRIVEIWSIQKADVVRSQKTASKPISLCWVNDDECLVGLEDGKISWFTLEEGKELLIEAHTTRVKSMVKHDETLVTASSSGDIKVWQIDATERTLTLITETNIGCRPICIGILDLTQFGTEYRVNDVTTEEKPAPRNVAKKSTQPRGIVTIEYEDENEESAEAENLNDDAAATSDEEEEASAESDAADIFDSDSEDSSDGDIELRAPKRKARRSKTAAPLAKQAKFTKNKKPKQQISRSKASNSKKSK